MESKKTVQGVDELIRSINEMAALGWNVTMIEQPTGEPNNETYTIFWIKEKASADV